MLAVIMKLLFVAIITIENAVNYGVEHLNEHNKIGYNKI